MFAGFTHEPQIESQVVDAGYLHGQDFLGDKQVAHVCLAIDMVNNRGTVFLQGGEVVGPLLVAHVHNAMTGKEHTIAAVARGHHTVHHINAAIDGLEHVGRGTDTHQVAGTVLRQDVIDDFYHLIHHLGGFTHGEAADGVTVGTQVGDKLGRFLTQVLIDTTLHDREIGLTVAVAGLCVLEVLPAAGQPVVGQRQRLAGIVVVAGAWRALVQRHHDVTADGAFNVHHLLGGKQVLATIDVAAKGHALVGQLAVLGQREHLEAATVGEDGTVPAVELVQTPGALDNVHAGAQIQVIGIAQDNLCLDVLTQFSHVNSLDGAHGAYGHKDGRLDLAMIGRDESGAGIGAAGCGYKLIVHSVVVIEKSCKDTKIVHRGQIIDNSFFREGTPYHRGIKSVCHNSILFNITARWAGN